MRKFLWRSLALVVLGGVAGLAVVACGDDDAAPAADAGVDSSVSDDAGPDVATTDGSAPETDAGSDAAGDAAQTVAPSTITINYSGSAVGVLHYGIIAGRLGDAGLEADPNRLPADIQRIEQADVSFPFTKTLVIEPGEWIFMPYLDVGDNNPPESGGPNPAEDPAVIYPFVVPAAGGATVTVTLTDPPPPM